MSLIINNEVVDPSLIDQEFSSIKSHYESLAQVSCCERDAEFLGYAKENITKRVLLAQEAERFNAPVLKKEVDAAFRRLVDQQGGEAAFYAHTGLSEEGEKQLRRDLGVQIRLDKYIDHVCGPNPDYTEEQVRAYYDKHLEDFMTEEEIRVSHIFKSLQKAESKTDLYDELRDVRRRCLAGEDFDELAKKISDKPAEEVDLGFFKRGEHMEEFETIVFSMEVDEVSPVFGTHWGFHLAKVTERKIPAPRDYNEIRDALKKVMVQEYRQEKVSAEAERLKETAKVVDDSATLESRHSHAH